MKEVRPKLKEVFDFLKKNKYVLATLIFVALILFSSYNVFKYRKLYAQRKELMEKKKYYENEIKKDSANTIKLQKSIKEIERYGREKFMMKRENEDIYIIKSSADTVKTDKK